MVHCYVQGGQNQAPTQGPLGGSSQFYGDGGALVILPVPPPSDSVMDARAAPDSNTWTHIQVHNVKSKVRNRNGSWNRLVGQCLVPNDLGGFGETSPCDSPFTRMVVCLNPSETMSRVPQGNAAHMVTLTREPKVKVIPPRSLLKSHPLNRVKTGSSP